MTRILSEAEIQASVARGESEVTVRPGTVVTPLARDTAEELGVDIVVGRQPAPGEAGRPLPAGTASRADLEVAARRLARRALIAGGGDLSGLDDLVEAVMARLGDVPPHDCACGEH